MRLSIFLIGIMHIIGGSQLNSRLFGEPHQLLVHYLLLGNSMILQFQKEISDLLSPEELYTLNQRAKERFIQSENIDALAKALTHYIFSRGPMENMHANGQLSQKDMKVLNKYMVDHLAWILTRVFEGDWIRLELLFNNFSHNGNQWDPADPQQVENP